jgi:hypothetical protein
MVPCDPKPFGIAGQVDQQCRRRFRQPRLAIIVGELQMRNVALICTSQGIDTSKQNPVGPLQLGVLMAVAEFERALIRERQREGIALAKQRGVYIRTSNSILGFVIRSLTIRLATGQLGLDYGTCRSPSVGPGSYEENDLTFIVRALTFTSAGETALPSCCSSVHPGSRACARVRPTAACVRAAARECQQSCICYGAGFQSAHRAAPSAAVQHGPCYF